MARSAKTQRYDAREAAAADSTGYSANGESQHSRQVATGAKQKIEQQQRRSWPQRGRRTLIELIAENATELEQLIDRSNRETDPERVRKIMRNIEIKQRFLATLRSEYQNAYHD
jgi:hypothetical protein